MNKFLIITVLAIIPVLVTAQDLLYFASGNILKTTNTTISTDSVSFQIFNSSQQKYSINKNELVKMITENGDIIKFSGKYNESGSSSFNKNIVSFNTLGIPMGRFTMSYQMLSKDGKVGVEFPVSVGLFNDTYTDPFPEIFDIELYSMFYSGVTVNWYPLGQRKVNYILGPSLRIGVGIDNNYYCYDCGYDYNSNKQMFYTKLLINNGLVLTPSEHFSMSFIFSLGVMLRDNYPGEETFGTTADFQFNLAYHF